MPEHEPGEQPEGGGELVTDVLAAVGKTIDMMQSGKLEEIWRAVPEEARRQLIADAAQLRPRTVGVVGWYRAYQQWREDTRRAAAAGDFEAYKVLRKEFWLGEERQLYGRPLENVYRVRGAEDFLARWGEYLEWRIEGAKAAGTWRGR